MRKVIRKIYSGESVMDIYEQILDGKKLFTYMEDPYNQYDVYAYNSKYYLIWWFDNCMQTINESTSLTFINKLLKALAK